MFASRQMLTGLDRSMQHVLVGVMDQPLSTPGGVLEPPPVSHTGMTATHPIAELPTSMSRTTAG